MRKKAKERERKKKKKNPTKINKETKRNTVKNRDNT